MSSSTVRFVPRSLLPAAGTTGAASVTGLLPVGDAPAVTKGPSGYPPTWSSICRRPPAPEWLQDVKFM